MNDYLNEGEENEDNGRHSEEESGSCQTAVLADRVTEVAEPGRDHRGIQREVKPSFRKALVRAGITPDRKAEGLLFLMENAEKAISTKDDGIVFVPDYGVRLAALKIAMQASGDFDPEEDQGNEHEGMTFVFVK